LKRGEVAGTGQDKPPVRRAQQKARVPSHRAGHIIRAAPSPMSLAPGTRIGPYEITAMLGAGGMGEVYRANDTRLARVVALKLLPSTVARDPHRLARFEREARAVAALSHSNILAIYDFGHLDGQTYATFELLEGLTLRERLNKGPLPPRKAASIAAQVARGL
jgi:serine/threonine protein kinase